MARPNPIRSIMAQPLPSITYQRRKQFRPSDYDLIYAYNIINRYVFNNELYRPEIQQCIIKKCWGMCHWLDEPQHTGSWCKIQLSDKWFCEQWFMNTLAHEMVHQYQWDIWRFDQPNQRIFEYSGGHGPSFFAWREQFEYYGLHLKTSHGQKRWFRHQDFTKC